MRLWTWILAWCAAMAVALVAGGAARADVASHRTDSGVWQLFFLEGGVVFRGACPAGTRFFDREICSLQTVRAPQELVTARYRAKLGPDLAHYDTLRTQTWQQIQAIDTRIFELLNTDPQGAPAVSREQLEAAERALAVQTLKTQDLKDQVARLTLALATDPHDAELLAQLELTRSRLSVEQKQENELVGSLNALRHTYVRERGSSQTADYEELLRLRTSRVSELEAWRSWVKRQIEDMEAGERHLAHLQDASFAWPVDSDPLNAALRFESAYAAAEVEARTMYVRAAERFRIQFMMTDARVVENVFCRTSTHAMQGVQFKFELRDDELILSQAVVPFTSVGMGLLEVDFGARTWSRNLLVEGGFIGRSLRGTWDIAYYYLQAPQGAAPVPFESLNCGITFTR